MSSDGRDIAFQSEATNLTTPAASGQGSVYVHDRFTGQTQLTSVNDAGEEGSVPDFYGLHLSADGRYVAFQSAASHLVPEDFNQSSDIFVRGPLYAGYAVSGTLELEDRAPDAPAQPITFAFRTLAGDPLFFRTAEVGADGNFALEGMQAGDYEVHIGGQRYLAVNRNVAIRDNVFGLEALLRTGDANGNNACDVLDLDILIQAFDTAPGYPLWEPGADFNADESIDVLDLDLWLRNFDTSGDRVEFLS